MVKLLYIPEQKIKETYIFFSLSKLWQKVLFILGTDDGALTLITSDR